jgi:hypothetical protein
MTKDDPSLFDAIFHHDRDRNDHRSAHRDAPRLTHGAAFLVRGKVF